ncbi:AraC family transcriptional regulator [Rhodopseudomonas telluris]|uniref:Helix-turn-helix domain-containing protein n=1 Tax=Rhodopseudomonas telluris TaxID=644215 RepID=A0ABV6EQW2_9BRAD
MKTTNSLAPSSALRICCFDDVDQYRWCDELVALEFIPLTRKISARQLIVSLPGFHLIVERTFPRLIDATLLPGSTRIGFSMCDDVAVQINGIDVCGTTLVLAYGGDSCVAHENTPGCFASVVFDQEIRDRGWPAPIKGFEIFTVSQPAHSRLRVLVQEIINLASQYPDDLRKPEVVEGMRESLLAAADEAFADSVSLLGSRSEHTERFLSIVKGIDEIIFANPANPIYSGELARALGVSVRTIHTAVLQYRGMSLHRYLRLKRLWLVRQRLLSGNISVKACALAYGFWHLSDFSRSYRTHFGELPSETLALAH